MMHRKKLKLALIDAELTHWKAAVAANKVLPAEHHLSEHDVSRLVAFRKSPSLEQAKALAKVLGWKYTDLFPDLTGGES
jgi:hypothetical protein